MPKLKDVREIETVCLPHVLVSIQSLFYKCGKASYLVEISYTRIDKIS